MNKWLKECTCRCMYKYVWVYVYVHGWIYLFRTKSEYNSPQSQFLFHCSYFFVNSTKSNLFSYNSFSTSFTLFLIHLPFRASTFTGCFRFFCRILFPFGFVIFGILAFSDFLCSFNLTNAILCPSPMVTRFTARCFELILRGAALVPSRRLRDFRQVYGIGVDAASWEIWVTNDL